MDWTTTLFWILRRLFLPVSTEPVSPYGVYNGQPRSCVYQPTEIALIAKGLTKVSEYTTFYTTEHPHFCHICWNNHCSVCFYRWSKTRWCLEPELPVWVWEVAAPRLIWSSPCSLKDCHTQAARVKSALHCHLHTGLLHLWNKSPPGVCSPLRVLCIKCNVLSVLFLRKIAHCSESPAILLCLVLYFLLSVLYAR